MFGRSTSGFDRLLEKATSQLLLEPDWTSIMMICDLIRQGDANPKYAVTAIKKKFYHSNPHVALYALQVMESCVKNCGALIHEEVATKSFMEELREMIKSSNDENIKGKVLEMIQTWGMAFRNNSKYRIVTDTLNVMKAEGYKFPPLREAEAMFEADIAPEWADGSVCHRCRVQFSTFTRQHHCRACGQVFCGKCSGKSCVLPKFGIEKEVRVCDSCFDQYGPNEEGPPKDGYNKTNAEGAPDLPAEYLASPLSKQQQEPPKPTKSEEELKEEEELQLALAMSRSEAEEKEKQKLKATSEILAGFGSGPGKRNDSAPAADTGLKTAMKTAEEADPELSRYLNRDYWENQARSQEPDAVSASSPAAVRVTELMQGAGGVAGGPESADEHELDEFVTTLKSQLEIFVNRMKSNSSRGRPIANDSSVQTLFMNTMAMHSKLVKFIQDQEDKRVHYEGLQDKLAQVKDARAALDALREEEAERKRREAEELERQRQAQMAAKLEVMRKKKAEYLEYQRQMALQRMADQEREMAMRQEVAKQSYMQQYYGYPQYPGYQYPPGQQPPVYQAAPGLPAPMPQQANSEQYPGGMLPPQQQQMPPGMMPPSLAHHVGGQQPQVNPEVGAPVAGMAPPPPGGQVGLQQQPFNMQGLRGALPSSLPSSQPTQFQPAQEQSLISFD